LRSNPGAQPTPPNPQRKLLRPDAGLDSGTEGGEQFFWRGIGSRHGQDGTGPQDGVLDRVAGHRGGGLRTHVLFAVAVGSMVDERDQCCHQQHQTADERADTNESHDVLSAIATHNLRALNELSASLTKDRCFFVSGVNVDCGAVSFDVPPVRLQHPPPS